MKRNSRVLPPVRRIGALLTAFAMLALLLPFAGYAADVEIIEDAGYSFGSFSVNGTTPVSLGVNFNGVVKFEYDLHIPANITSANNAVVFGGDGLSAWAGVGAALYINSSWSGSTDVFYTQNASGDGTGVVQNSSLGWKNKSATQSKSGYTTYHVEQTIDTATAIAKGCGVYQIYMTPEGGERTLITTGTAPGTSKSGWHGFRTSYTEITKIGVWTNGGVDISISNLKAWWIEGNIATVSVDYEIDGTTFERHVFSRGIGETFTYRAPKTIMRGETTYYLTTSKDDLSVTVTSSGAELKVAYSTQPPEYDGEQILYLPFDGADNNAALSGDYSFELGQAGNSLHLGSNSGYAQLKQGILADADELTIACWAKCDSLLSWARIFDFGSGTSSYIFLAPYSGAGKTVFAITNSGSGSEQKITINSPFAENVWTHVAITMEDNTAVLYINGEEAGRNDNVTLKASDLGNTTANYLGKSQYPDAYFKGNLDEFAVYNYAMRAEDVKKLMTESAAKVAWLEEIALEIAAGDTVNLPKYVAVRYENGMSAKAGVAWEDAAIPPFDGTYTVNGTVTAGGREYAARAVVTVTSEALIDGYSVKSLITAANGNVFANFDVYSGGGETVWCLLSIMDKNGAFNSAAGKKITLTGFDSFSTSCAVPQTVAGDGYAAKIFLWKENMEPVTNGKTREFEAMAGGSFFSVDDVTLLDGKFKESQEVGEAYILSLDADRLLAPFYEAAGLTPKAPRYGGWESMQISGHSLGHWMSALAVTYQATGNEELKRRLDYAVDELAYVQAQYGNGYIGGVMETPFLAAFSGNFTAEKFSLAGYWVPWYNIHKVYQGLIDAYTKTGNTTALRVVTKFADWAKRGTDKMTDAQMQKMLTAEHGGMNDVFAQLYGITGNADYLTLAERFTHQEILAPLEREQDALTGLHANTQIPKIIGAAEIYNQDNTRTEYKTAAKFFWNAVVGSRSYVFGGNSIGEHFEALGSESLGIKTAESCNTHNMLKLTEKLYQWEHNSAYMDYFENALFNHILGTQDPETGHKTYFTSTLPGHYRIYGTGDSSFWCCVGTGMENPGRYGRGIYYKDGSDLFVNLFISSEVNWREKGLKIRQETNLPYEDTVLLTIAEGSAEANINIRVPSWVDGEMRATVNGEKVYTKAGAGYLTISGKWNAGDTIELKLPMTLNVYTSRDNSNKVAFRYGPVVLAGALGTDGLPNDTVEKETGLDSTTTDVPYLITGSDDIDSIIRLTDPGTLTFTIDGAYTSTGKAVTLKPFSDIHHEFYNVYWYMNEDAGRFEKALNNITIDSVTPDGQQDEIGHNLQKNNSNNGTFVYDGATYKWRDAWGSADAYFSYEMKVDGSAQNYVYASYWGSDGPFTKGGVSYTREFDILVDGVVIGSQTINNNSPGKAFYQFYEIPRSLTEGKTTVTVKFAVKSGTSCAGGVLDVRTTKEGSISV